MNKCIAKYLRLSQDDENAGESNSIVSQRQIIDNYLSSEVGFSNSTVTEFIDDGYTGTNFNRPGVKRLLEAVRKGEVSCIVVKDFSRFGRQYLEVSKLIEQLFPYLGVRFIAVNDHYDSNTHKGTTAELDVPVRNMINAMYSRDISKKVKSAKRTQAKQGVFSNAFAPFGYKKDETDRHRLLIDEPAAEIVRRIFAHAGEGHSLFQIADKLNADSVLTPAQHKKHNGSRLAVGVSSKGFWTGEMVSRILHDERYTGTLICGQHETMQIGSGKKRHTPKETWIRIPDALPAIISSEQFHSTVVNRQQFAKTAKPNTERVLYKKVRCGYCDHVMQYVGKASKPYYRCDILRYTDQYGCLPEIFREADIVNKVKTVTQSQIALMLDLEKLCKKNKKELKQTTLFAETSAFKLDNEIKQLQAQKRQLYERYKSGSLDKMEYFAEREALDAAIGAKTTQRDTLLVGRDKQVGTVHSAHEFFVTFLKFQETADISDSMIDELVETVYVYASDRIEVRFSFMDEYEQAIAALEALNRPND